MAIAPVGGTRARLRPGDVARLALSGLRGRPARAVLSAAGIALGVATVVAVLGISASSRSQLVHEIDSLGTNLLVVTADQQYSAGSSSQLPAAAAGMVARITPVAADATLGGVSAAVYRSDRLPSYDTRALTVDEVHPDLLSTLEGHMASGRFLNHATARLPAVVLGATTAHVLGVDRIGTQVWLGHRWFSVVGILRPVKLAPELDRSALIGYPIARSLLGASARPVELFVRTNPTQVGPVSAVLAATVDPAAPQDVTVTDPTDALIARADASSALQSLFVGLGAVALVVGGVGVANIMVIAVIERRGEIGVRRSLGAARAHVAAQFIGESCLLALLGGVAGAGAGGLATELYAHIRHWSAVVSPGALGAAVATAIAVGAAAGTYPALKAARVAPADALRSL